MALEALPSSEEIIRILLEETNTTDPPTNPEKIADYLDLRIVYFNNHDDYGLNSRIRAFLWPKKRLIGVYADLMRVQQRFSILHEVGHYVLPGHLGTMGEDDKFKDDTETFRATRITKGVIQSEIEANQFAADCLFQLDKFDDYINRSQINWLNIISAADLFGASIEATARRWVERINGDCALVVFRPPKNTTEEAPLLEVMYTVTSPSFHYFTSLRPEQKMPSNSAVHGLFYDLYGSYDTTLEDTLAVRLAEQVVHFNMQLFTNRYRVFGIITPIES
jgi:Zn-dependent peptidase ImmA (M78 family)